MINKELLDYIAQQVRLGVSSETIKASLKSQNWSEQDVDEGFFELQKSVATPHSSFTPPLTAMQSMTPNKQNSIWFKTIPRINKVFMVVSLVLVFGVDLMIIINDSSLMSFWYMMLGVLALFAVFFYLENFVFRDKFANSISNLDRSITSIVVIRNLIFLLNFIPLIQLLGLVALVYLGWLLGIIYIILIFSRFSQLKKAGISPQV